MFEYSKLYIKYIMFNKFKKLVDKGEMLWYSNIAVGESGALQELQKFLKKEIFKKMKKFLTSQKRCDNLIWLSQDRNLDN